MTSNNKTATAYGTPMSQTSISSTYMNDTDIEQKASIKPLFPRTKPRRCNSQLSKREPLAFLIMRINLKIVLFLLSLTVIIITLLIYMRCSDFTLASEFTKHYWAREEDETSIRKGTAAAGVGHRYQGSVEDSPAHLQDIKCLINQEYAIQCKKDIDTSEIYVPFTFLRSYFEVTGSIATADVNNGDEEVTPVFHWMHSTAKINMPKGKYDPRGAFTYFEFYNVEVRDRVKCISAAEGVPISTQWEKRGYFYPTQIAQFALAHYSKNLSEAEPRIKIIDDTDNVQAVWTVPKLSNLSRVSHPKAHTNVAHFDTAIDFDSAISVGLNQSLDLVLNVDLWLATNSSSLIVTILNRELNVEYRMHYVPMDLVLSVQGQNIYYGLGGGGASLNRWRHLTRDLAIDLQKGMSANDKKALRKVKRPDLRVLAIAFLGVGHFDNLTFSTYNHLAHFYDAAEWFVNHQDAKTGGWPNPVRRHINGFTELKAGWLSAMGQGHAISVLARAYWHSGGDKRYLKAASLGLRPFHVTSKEGGVLAQFMDKYWWYEEYPTIPSSFVLNGFIYALFGLYDLNATAPANIAREAGELFQQGLLSLKKMLLLYDTGSGTSYDLRHLSLGVAPNLARWDYHATHVSQLLLLATIDSDPLISQTAERWKGYMLGKRAKHN